MYILIDILSIIGILVNLHHDVNYSSDDISDEDTQNNIFSNENKENRNEEQSQNTIFQRKGSLITHRNNAGKTAASVGSKQCGPINLEAVQQVLAAKWAIDVINNQSLPHEIKIGKYFFHYFYHIV